MVSVIVTVLDEQQAAISPEGVVRTLASLVPAAVEGVVRDVTLAAPSGRPGMRKIADHAGCELIESDDPARVLGAALMAARNANVFILRAGRAPETGFTEELTDLLSTGAGAAIMRESPRRLLTRVVPLLAPIAGLVSRRDRLLDTKARAFHELVRHAGSLRAMRTRARLVE
jgi:hypothetical protein